MKKFGDLVRKYRTQRSMTLREFGQKLNLTPQKISDWEGGRRLPTANSDLVRGLSFLEPDEVFEMLYALSKETGSITVDLQGVPVGKAKKLVSTLVSLQSK